MEVAASASKPDDDPVDDLEVEALDGAEADEQLSHIDEA